MNLVFIRQIVAHRRDSEVAILRQLIANYIMDRTGAIQIIERNGKHYVVIRDFDKMREGVGMLLTELMRIKAEGDYAAIKELIDKYAVNFDPKVRDEVVARFKKLNLPTYWAGVDPELSPVMDGSGKITSAQMSYPRDFMGQRLRYSAMYDPALVTKRGH